MRFKPITLERPRALLPLAGSPLIDYTLEFLISAGITDIVVFCCAHAEMILDHLNHRWPSRPEIGLTITPVIGTDSESAGDALREMNEGGYIRGDFILVNGDVVSNTKLKQAIELHRQLKKKDPGYVMTSIFKKAGPSHRTRAGEDDTVLAIDPQTSQLLYYENNREQRVLKVDRSLFLEHPTVQFRYDLLDCNIDICTPTVLTLFKEQFDFRHPRRDFLASLLNKGTEENPQVHRVFSHIIDTEYAARVRDLYTYGAVSRDIVRRWTHPLVPDNNIVDPASGFTYSRGNIYLDKGIVLARGAVIGQNTIIGEGTQIDGDAQISNSVIGRNCVIGRGVRLQNSFVWDNVVIEDNCTISSSIVCSGVTLRAGVAVEPGAVLSFDVEVPARVIVPRETKLTLRKDGSNTSVFPEQTSLFVWQPDPNDADLVQSGLRPKKGNPNPNSLIYCPFETESDLSETDDDEEETEQEEEISNFEKFESNISELTQQAVKKDLPADDIEVQIKAEKFAADRTWLDCAQVFVPTLLMCFAEMHAEAETAKLAEQVLVAIVKFKKILSILCRNDGDQEDDQVELILMVQEVCEQPAGAPLRPIFHVILHRLYMEEIIDKEAINEWHKDVQQDEDIDDVTNDLLARCADFIQWLNEDEDDEEEDEESE